ncbi:MAG: DNA helicase RecQ [Chloroflexi bacterium]|nr:DNA helicase RecQ [Chloroflexota bacterium]
MSTFRGVATDELDIRQILRARFGYDEFRPLQAEIISNVLAGQDTLVLMPTGGGKSLCYQLPALCFDGLTLVISPLIALMKDQVDALRTNGIAAAFINSSVPLHEVSSIYAAARAGRLKLLYIAPERLAVPGFEEFLRGLGVAQVAIDEAHCISEWGHDFRPDYRNLRSLRAMFPRAPVMALTATATAKVRDDIAEQLMIPQARWFIASFNRENLTYIVRPKRRPFDHLVRKLRRHADGASIVYCLSRDGTERLATKLSQHGLPALPYHAGLDPSLRRNTQERFIRDEARIIVATIAFGMGIDKPDVRLIAHYDLPKTLEGYYQETGRAGRDGLPSECVLYFSAGDRARFTHFINEIEDPAERARAQQKLEQMIAYGEARTCRRAFVLHYFGETYDKTDCGGCDVCLAEREAFDATEIAQMVLSAVIRTGERFGPAHVINVLRGSRAKKVLEWRHHELPVYGIARAYDRDELKEILDLLEDEGLLQRSPDKFATISVTAAGYYFLRRRETLTLNRIRRGASQTQAGPRDPRATSDVPRTTGETLGANRELFDCLRELRRRLAEARDQPAFVIFSNRTLEEMARAMPRDHAGFADLPGVGPAKLEEFADDFLQVIREYTASRDAE